MLKLAPLAVRTVLLGLLAALPAPGQTQVVKKAMPAPFPCQTTWTAPPLDQLTPNIISTPLANGYVLYTVHVALHTPENNQTECSVRQYRIHLPALQNWLLVPNPTDPSPTIQITIESPSSVGYGDALQLYSIVRFDHENGFSGFVLDAQTPNSYQSPYQYYAAITVIAKPVVTPRK